MAIRPRTRGVTVKTTTGRNVNLTTADVQSYLQGLVQTRHTISSAPYTVWSGGRQTGTVSRPQFLSGMQRLGYTDQQIHAVTTGLASNANPGLLQRVINSIASASPAVAPELPGIFSKFATATNLFDTRPSELPKSEVTPADTTKDSQSDTSVRDTSRDTTKDEPATTRPRDTIPKRDILPRIAAPGVTGAGESDILGIGSILDFLKFIAWLFHPLNLLRAAEFLTGLAFFFYGLNVLMHGARRNAATHRYTLGGLLGSTPIGRAMRVRRARRRGRRAGELQAERDVAYRGARQRRARSVGAGQRTTPGSGTGGTGQGSSALE